MNVMFIVFEMVLQVILLCSNGTVIRTFYLSSLT